MSLGMSLIPATRRRYFSKHVNFKMADKDEQEPTPAQDIVVTKYKMAGDMVNGMKNNSDIFI